MILKPRFQSVWGLWSHSQRGSGFSNSVIPIRLSGHISLVVDALVRLSASRLAGELRRGTWRAKMRHSRKQATRCRALIRAEAVRSPFTEPFSHPNTTLTLSTPRTMFLPWIICGTVSKGRKSPTSSRVVIFEAKSAPFSSCPVRMDSGHSPLHRNQSSPEEFRPREATPTHSSEPSPPAASETNSRAFSGGESISKLIGDHLLA